MYIFQNQLLIFKINRLLLKDCFYQSPLLLNTCGNFNYGIIQTGKSFTDTKKNLKKLTRNVNRKSNTIHYSLRELTN